MFNISHLEINPISLKFFHDICSVLHSHRNDAKVKVHIRLENSQFSYSIFILFYFLNTDRESHFFSIIIQYIAQLLLVFFRIFFR